MTLFTNHVGYFPFSSKQVCMGGVDPCDFEVISTLTGQTVFQGRLKPGGADFGPYLRGEFSALSEPGRYILRAGREETLPFEISSTVYDDAIAKILGYFALQRCGDSQTGWNGPCHLDDGLRGDDYTHRSVTGGWHDACDLRKWVSATIYGLLSLARSEIFTPQIDEEIRWGNRYFLAMQEPEGYLMDYVGGDYFVHADNNRWTDSIADGADDRLINVNPGDPVAQWAFVQAESLISLRFRETDPAYAYQCLDAALSCAAWTLRSQTDPDASVLGAGISALLALTVASGDRLHQQVALKLTHQLLRLQVPRALDSRSEVYGFFFEKSSPGQSPMTFKPHFDLWRGCWPFFSLTELLLYMPDHPDSDIWRKAIEKFMEGYLIPLATRNAFQIVPLGLFRTDPGGSRNLGRFYFRYFYPENPDWYVGINANLASTGLAVLKAGLAMERPEWKALAQRQLDWILGSNPFNASTVMQVGHNNPQHMLGAEFIPATPFLPGAVMNGISGTADDKPQLRPGYWQETEYWTPMAAYTLWLLAELRKAEA